MEGYYCGQFDAYFVEGEWLEGKCCTAPTKDCYFNCWERPDIPCKDCKYEEGCEDKIG